MALSAGNILEVQTGGNDANGGGFNPSNANFPTDGAATSATGASPVFSSASYTFVAGDVGHWVYIKSGTNWTPGWYLIASVAGGAATLSAAVGAGVLAKANQPIGPTLLVGCATTASPTAATWGLDYSQTASARLAFTDMVIGGTTTQFTSVANPVGKNFVGNLINVTGGTGFTVQWVEVVSTVTTTATCDKSLGTTASTGGIGNLGGALASPVTAFTSVVVASNVVFTKSGTYSGLSASIAMADGSGTVAPTCIIGYGSVRMDDGTRPILRWGSAVTGFTASGINSRTYVRNFIVDGNSVGTIGFGGSNAFGLIELCQIKGWTTSGGSIGSMFRRCEINNNAKGLDGNFTWNLYACYIHNNTGVGAGTAGGGNGSVINGYFCIFSANGGIGCEHGRGCVLVCCVAYGNTGAGFTDTVAGAVITTRSYWNCISYGNGTYGFADSGIPESITRYWSTYLKCAGGNNSSGNFNTFADPPGFVTLTADPFTNAASGDFSLNTTAGGGALCRATGFPGAFPGGLTTGYLDIGAVQHADPTPFNTIRLIQRSGTN